MPRRTKVNPKGTFLGKTASGKANAEKLSRVAKEITKILEKNNLNYYEGFGILQSCIHYLVAKRQRLSGIEMMRFIFPMPKGYKSLRKKPKKKK